MTTIVIIEDHPVYRSGLKTIIHEDFGVIGETGTAESGLGLVREKNPDIAIIDIMLPDYDGIRLTREITESCDTKVMIISNHSKMEYVKRAFQSGAMGYVIKESGEECVMKCLRSIRADKNFIDNSLSENLCVYFSEENRIEVKMRKYDQLSDREQSVFRLWVKDSSLKDIGFELGINEKTVSSYKSRIVNKLGISGTSELIRFAIDIGLIQ